jgi:hypothetical protein
MTNKCKNCKYFTPNENGYPAYVLDGECSKIAFGPDATQWNEDTMEDELQPEYRDTLAFCADGSAYSAVVFVSKDFGCVMWEGQEND